MRVALLCSMAASVALLVPIAVAQEAVPAPPAESAAVAEPGVDSMASPVAAPAPDASAAPAQDAAAVPATEGASADTGTGTVIFFRPSKFVGAVLGFKVRENGKELGKLRNGTYFVLPVPAGTHQYEVQGEAKDVLTLEVEAGETYYVQGLLGVGIVAGRPNLTPSDAATFEGLKAKLKEVPPLSGDDAEAK
jgi:hypothetical protein